jgi:GNAT superfamily N-acetyltransferase
MAGMTKATYFLRPGSPADVAAEQKAWRTCAKNGGLVFAESETEGARVGFFALGDADDEAYLEQIAVLPTHIRRGIGRQLMTAVIAMARRRGHTHLVLTIYDHVPWNRPYYEALGFAPILAERVGPSLRHDLATQRRYLPMPHHRIAMRKVL